MLRDLVERQRRTTARRKRNRILARKVVTPAARPADRRRRRMTLRLARRRRLRLPLAHTTNPRTRDEMREIPVAYLVRGEEPGREAVYLELRSTDRLDPCPTRLQREPDQPAHVRM